MSSNFSPSLRIELIGDGDQSGIWGQTTNQNLGTLIEQAITGVQTIAMADANYTMSNFNGVADEARNAILVLTGTLTQQRSLIAPLVEKAYSIKNSTTGGFGVQIVGSSGTGVVIPNGQTIPVYCDGTNFYSLLTGSATNFSIAGNLSVSGTTDLVGNLTGTTAAFSGSISSVSPSFTGTPTAPTASTATNTTQIATTAYVKANITALALGTMATQNANAVAITGGAIDNTTVGATTASTVRGTTITATTQFTGPGTGLSGTASSLSIGGNAATATNPAGGGTFITSSNIGSQSVNFATTAGSANAVAWSNVSGRPYPTTSNWSYSGQSGQPSWLWGTNDGSNMLVWNPSNFSVNYATSAGSATNATNATNASFATTQPNGTNNTTIATTAFVQNSAAAPSVPSGAVMLFYQASAPTGWTQVTSLNDYDLRLVSGSGGTTGGSTAYSTVFSNQTPSISVSGSVGATTLSTSQIPSHTHSYEIWTNSAFYGPNNNDATYGGQGTTASTTGAEGGGGSHTHSLSVSGSSSAITLNVRYANVIICSKN